MHIDPAAAVILPIRRVVSLLVHTEHAFDSADNATDRAADNRADRPCHAAAFIEPVGDTTRHTLRLRGNRRRQRCEQCAREQNPQLHCTTLYELGRGAHLPREKRP
jgi:hypothetical protein